MQVFGIAAALARQGQLPMVSSKDSTPSFGATPLQLFEDREIEDYFMSTYDNLRYVCCALSLKFNSMTNRSYSHSRNGLDAQCNQYKLLTLKTAKKTRKQTI